MEPALAPLIQLDERTTRWGTVCDARAEQRESLLGANGERRREQHFVTAARCTRNMANLRAIDNCSGAGVILAVWQNNIDSSKLHPAPTHELPGCPRWTASAGQ